MSFVRTELEWTSKAFAASEQWQEMVATLLVRALGSLAGELALSVPSGAEHHAVSSLYRAVRHSAEEVVSLLMKCEIAPTSRMMSNVVAALFEPLQAQLAAYFETKEQRLIAELTAPLVDASTAPEAKGGAAEGAANEAEFADFLEADELNSGNSRYNFLSAPLERIC